MNFGTNSHYCVCDTRIYSCKDVLKYEYCNYSPVPSFNSNYNSEDQSVVFKHWNIHISVICY